MPPSCVAGTMRPSVASITMPSWHHAAKLAHRVCCITKWTSLRRSGLIAEQATNSTGESSCATRHTRAARRSGGTAHADRTAGARPNRRYA
eukprot:4971523-Prymnesium_polylepis.1